MGMTKEDIHSTSGVLTTHNETDHMTQEASFPTSNGKEASRRGASFPTTNGKEASRRKSLPKRHLGVLDVGCYGFQGSTNQKRTKLEPDKQSDTEDSQVRCGSNCGGGICFIYRYIDFEFSMCMMITSFII